MTVTLRWPAPFCPFCGSDHLLPSGHLETPSKTVYDCGSIAQRDSQRTILRSLRCHQLESAGKRPPLVATR